MKTDLFQSCGHCWVFQICWHIECSTFTASSFSIWNSSTGIPSPPLALFIVMLSKAHLTLHSRMSGSRSVITPSWLSGSWRSFLYNSSVYSCHLFSFCYFHTLSVLYCFHICWHFESSTFTASSFRIWNSSTGIPSPLLALFIVMLSKAHLTFLSSVSYNFLCTVLLSP